jgi:hypothetical protein
MENEERRMESEELRIGWRVGGRWKAQRGSLGGKEGFEQKPGPMIVGKKNGKR